MSWHGMSEQDILTRWNEYDWQKYVHETLMVIASAPDALVEDRLLAMQLFDTAVAHSLLPADPHFPDFCCRVLLHITRGFTKRGSRRAHRSHGARLAGVRALLRTVANFTPVMPQPKAGALLS